MHLACFRHLPLCCVPYRVVGFRLLKLRCSIAVGSHIIQVVGEGLLRPGRKAGGVVIVRIIPTEVVCQLPPDNQLFKKRLRLLRRIAPAQNLQRRPLRRQLAEVQVGRQLRLPVQCRIIAIHAVIVQPVLQKRLQAKLGRLRARLQPAGFTYPAIEVQPGQQAFNFR